MRKSAPVSQPLRNKGPNTIPANRTPRPASDSQRFLTISDTKNPRA